VYLLFWVFNRVVAPGWLVLQKGQLIGRKGSVRSGFHFPAQNATWTMTWCQKQGTSDRFHLTPAQA